MKSFGARASIALIVAGVMVFGGVATSASAAPRDDVVTLTNQQRYSAGLPALTRDATLDAVAQEWAQNMSNARNMVHSTNEWRAARIPAGWFTNGENIAYGYGSAASVMNGWMNSPGHKANILRSNYTHIGVGYVASGNYWVQIFAGYDASTAPKRPPFGKLDGAGFSVQGASASLTVHGWAVDGANASTSIEAHVYVTDPTGSTKGYALKADQARPDIAAVYSLAGAAHGYKTTIPVTKTGTYTVCAYAIGVPTAGTNNVGIGCASVKFDPSAPIGNVDGVAVSVAGKSATLTVGGWALDNGSRASATQAHIYVKDPTGKTVGYALDANKARPDVGNAYAGAGPSHGFNLSLPLSTQGAYQVCAYSIGAVVFGSSNKSLGCSTASFGPSRPIGSFDSAGVDRSTLSITAKGWVFDDGARSIATQAHVYVTSPSGKRAGYAVDATQQRPDVARVFSGAGDAHGFSVSMPVTELGRYQVCAYSISASIFGSGNSSLSCKPVTVG